MGINNNVNVGSGAKVGGAGPIGGTGSVGAASVAAEKEVAAIGARVANVPEKNPGVGLALATLGMS